MRRVKKEHIKSEGGQGGLRSRVAKGRAIPYPASCPRCTWTGYDKDLTIHLKQCYEQVELKREDEVKLQKNYDERSARPVASEKLVSERRAEIDTLCNLESEMRDAMDVLATSFEELQKVQEKHEVLISARKFLTEIGSLSILDEMRDALEKILGNSDDLIEKCEEVQNYCEEIEEKHDGAALLKRSKKRKGKI